MKNKKIEEFMNLLDEFKNSLVSSHDMSKATELIVNIHTFINLNKQILNETKNINELIRAFNNLIEYREALEKNNFEPKNEKDLFEPFNKLIDAINIYIRDNSMEYSVERSIKPTNKVFIVHGHDDALKNEVARFIEKLGLEAIILHEQANKGKTIIEKIEYYSDVSFGIVLYTPCDIGGETKENLQPRARQNVVFEHGYLIGKIGS